MACLPENNFGSDDDVNIGPTTSDNEEYYKWFCECSLF